MTDSESPPRIRPELKDHYVCCDCNFEWYGEEQDCPECESTRTGMIVPGQEEMH